MFDDYGVAQAIDKSKFGACFVLESGLSRIAHAICEKVDLRAFWLTVDFFMRSLQEQSQSRESSDMFQNFEKFVILLIWGDH